MYPELIENSARQTVSVVTGLAPKASYVEEGSEVEVGGENGGCKCGPDCKCNPCNCK